jgi:hypothetical protein
MPDAGYSDELAFHREPTATDLLSDRNGRTDLMVNHPEMVGQDHLLPPSQGQHLAVSPSKLNGAYSSK